ncbi:MAG: 2OG-Fe(II) oxygenase, partial [Myxococcota bacterium]
GFSVIFRRSHGERAMSALAALAPYLDRATVPEANALYLNALVLGAGAGVGAHVDTSLSSAVGSRVHPVVVSVLYVDVPGDLRGGELVLRQGGRRVAVIAPTENTLLWFRGDLDHAVTRVRTRELRISLVCEQYRLPPGQLARVPTAAVVSTAS